jgi:hypothetical protein
MVLARDKLTALDRENIRKVASLRFAEDLAPDAMAGMTAKDKNGVTQVVRLPAEVDPTLTRIEKIRERDTAVVDTVNDYYASFHDSMEDSYGSWRQTSFTELEKEMRARSPPVRVRCSAPRRSSPASSRPTPAAPTTAAASRMRRAMPAPWAASPPSSRVSRNTPTHACTPRR